MIQPKLESMRPVYNEYIEYLLDGMTYRSYHTIPVASHLRSHFTELSREESIEIVTKFFDKRYKTNYANPK